MKIGIDPGVSGGIAFSDYPYTKLVQAMKMPETPKDIYDFLQSLAHEDGAVCVCEKVGTYRPGNSATAAVKFARHCGQLDMALLALGISTTYITPHGWMKEVVKTVPKEKKERKNRIKELMQQQYPHLKVTLATADALGILTYAMQGGR